MYCMKQRFLIITNSHIQPHWPVIGFIKQNIYIFKRKLSFPSTDYSLYFQVYWGKEGGGGDLKNLKKKKTLETQKNYDSWEMGRRLRILSNTFYIFEACKGCRVEDHVDRNHSCLPHTASLHTLGKHYGCIEVLCNNPSC